MSRNSLYYKIISYIYIKFTKKLFFGLNNISFDHTGNFEAAYGDGSLSLAEIKEKSDAILFGKVVEQYNFSPVSVVSKINVIHSYKGEKLNQISIYQIKGNEVLELDKEYMLFLGKQGDGKPDTFYFSFSINFLTFSFGFQQLNW